MKIRLDFVTNSSSSSFAVMISENDVQHILYDHFKKKYTNKNFEKLKKMIELGFKKKEVCGKKYLYSNHADHSSCGPGWVVNSLMAGMGCHWEDEDYEKIMLESGLYPENFDTCDVFEDIDLIFEPFLKYIIENKDNMDIPILEENPF